MQSVLLTPGNALIKIDQPILLQSSVLLLNDLRIHRHSHMIQTPFLHQRKIPLDHKGIVVLLSVIAHAALGQPASQIHASVKSLEFFHNINPFFFQTDIIHLFAYLTGFFVYNFSDPDRIFSCRFLSITC